MNQPATSSPPSDDAALQLVAERFRVLADAGRLRILHALEAGELSVSAICTRVDLRQPSVSKHLKALTTMGFVARRPEGNQALYCIADDMVLELCRLVCDGLRQRLEAQINVLPQQTKEPEKRS